MNLTDIKTYLTKRINTEDFLSLSDEELEKYMYTADKLLNTYYKVETIIDEDVYIGILAEEMLFLSKVNIDLNLFYEYNGLTSFNIGGAVQGSVDYSNKGNLFSIFVKASLENLGIEKKTDLPENRTKNIFSWT